MSEKDIGFVPVTEYLGNYLMRRYFAPLRVEKWLMPQRLEGQRLYQMSEWLWKRITSIRAKDFPIRMLEVPPDLQRRMNHKTPQFFLRNIPRIERSVPDALECEVVQVRDVEAERVIETLRHMRYRPPEFIKEWNLELVIKVRALFKRVIFEEDWTRRFGREIKERIRGPLYKYDPHKVE